MRAISNFPALSETDEQPSLTALLRELTRRGIRLAADGGRLRYFPQHAVSPRLLEALRHHKLELTELLARDGRCDLADSDWFEAIVDRMVDRLNAVCPADWQPAPSDWQRLDGLEHRIIEARQKNDRARFVAAIADYERIARALFQGPEGSQEVTD